MPKTKRQIAEEAKGIVADLLEKEVEELAEPRRMRPGEVNRGGVKTPWTMKDLDEAYGVCEFTPDETIPVTVSGITLYLFDGVGMVAPTCFRDVWLKTREARRGKVTLRSLQSMGIIKEDYPGSL